MQVDLSSFKSVIAFAEQVNADPDRLDIVVANAGVAPAKFVKTADGHEETIQVNGLSTGLMSMLLLPKLAATADKPAPSGSNLKPTLCLVASEGESCIPFQSSKLTYDSTLLGSIPTTRCERFID
jgi:retinol dehydrogenase-12